MRPAIAKIALCCLGLCLTVSKSAAVTPPSPGVETPAGFGKFLARQNRIYLSNLRPSQERGKGPILARAAQQKIILPVILAAYSDRPGVIQPETFTDKLFLSYLTGTMSEYYAEVSSGGFTLEGEVFGWFATSRTQVQYNSGGPLGQTASFPESPEGFVVDAVTAADSQVDFSRFDNDGPDSEPNSGDDDGYVDALIVVHPGGDAANGDQENFWSHTSRLGSHIVETNDPAAGGGFIKIDQYSLAPELVGDGSSDLAAEIGVFCHELGHQLGLIDLYDTGYNSVQAGEGVSYGIGIWGLMGLGINGADSKSPGRPTHFCAWSKLRLGWVDPVHEDEVGELYLAPVGQSAQVVRVWDNDERALSYFLLSYRTRQGFDRDLPAEGLLIWHVDERAFDNNDALLKLVDLEEADGRADLDNGVNTGDAGDAFPGEANNTGFASLTNPSSARNDGLVSDVLVTGIRIEAGQAVFNLSQPSRTGLTVFYDEDGPRQERGFGYGSNLAHGGVIFTAPVDGTLGAISTYFIYDSTDYTVEIYSGADSGSLRCPVSWQSGQAGSSGWRSIVLEGPICLETGDTVVAVVGYTSKGFDDLWPVPYDPTGRPEGRSWVSFSGLGTFEPFEHDLAIRAIMWPGVQAPDAMRLEAGFMPGADSLCFGITFIGERYRLGLPIYNPGFRTLLLSGIEIQGESFSADPVELSIGCGSTLEAGVLFSATTMGKAAGTVTVVPLGDNLEEFTAGLSAEVAGWSVRYDSSDFPGGYESFTESVHGAVAFSMPQSGLLSGIRTFILQDSMKVCLRLWAGVKGGGGHCLVAETQDTLFEKGGWHQVFLPIPVQIDSADTFIADVQYSTPGHKYLKVVPADTARTALYPSYYNMRETEGWLSSSHPVAIRALIIPAESYIGEIVRKKPSAALSKNSLAFGNLTVGKETSRSLWLYNRGTAVLHAALVLTSSSENAWFSLEAETLSIPCADSAFIRINCLAAKPGTETGVLELRTSDDERPILRVPLGANSNRFELAYDEQGHTASAGYNDSIVYGAVVFSTPWGGKLEALGIYLNQPNLRITALVYKNIKGPAQWEDSTEIISQWSDTAAAWQELSLEVPVSFTAGDSFAVVVSLIEPPGGSLLPLSVDHRGEPSGRSWAAKNLSGPWEQLNYDINLRAVMRVSQFDRYPVSGVVLDEMGEGLAEAEVSLVSEKQVYRTWSDSHGIFIFPSVQPGDYSLEGSLEGYSFTAGTVLIDSTVDGLTLTGRRGRPGDLDNDGRVDIFDLIGLLRIISRAEQETGTADLDGSGAVDIFDLIELLKLLSG